ncbi:MAG: PQQ-binding-like beta-propeller repeat protein [Cellvibrionaceae bacterium]
MATAFTSAQESEPGQAIYQQNCAVCHNSPDSTRAPALSALQLMSPQALRYTLTNGVMQQQAINLKSHELDDVINYLAADSSVEGDWVAGMMCSEKNKTIDLKQPASLSMFGVDHKSSRHLTAQQAGLSSNDLKNLELAWAIGFPNTKSLRSSPVIVGSTLFYTPDPTGKLLALDTESACVKWVYEAGGALRSSISYGDLDDAGKKVLILADRMGQVHAVNPKDGSLIWKAEAKHSKRAGITGSPVLYKDKIIVPLSASGVGSGANPNFECCVEHGAVIALNKKTGEKLWTYHTTPDAKYTGKLSKIGVKLRGPSGAPVWSTPTVDAKRGLVYITTGQNTSLPATTTSDAVLALDIETGKLKWHFQALANDVWNLACREPHEKSGPNCPSPKDSVLKDYDFGAAAIIAQDKNGKDIILAGQKSGDVWALDPDNNGKLIWRNTFGYGSPLGGIHWGMAIDGTQVYAPISDPHMPQFKDYIPQPGMNAIDITSGKVLWQTPITSDCSGDRKKRFDLCDSKYGLSAAPLSIDKSVIAGALDGRLYIFDGKNGEIIWQYDTLKDFKTLNGITANGGGIDSHSVFAGNGMVFVSSGYGGFRQPPGNVLLAFKPKAK